MRPLFSNSAIAALAREAFIRKRSTRTDGVMSLAVGTSLKSLSNVALSNVTALLALSLTFPFDHFYLTECIISEDEKGNGKK